MCACVCLREGGSERERERNFLRAPFFWRVGSIRKKLRESMCSLFLLWGLAPLFLNIPKFEPLAGSLSSLAASGRIQSGTFEVKVL